jgi:hypothetical protein
MHPFVDLSPSTDKTMYAETGMDLLNRTNSSEYSFDIQKTAASDKPREKN